MQKVLNMLTALWRSDAKAVRATRVLLATTLGIVLNAWIDSGLGVSGLADVFRAEIDMALRSGLIAALLILGVLGTRRMGAGGGEP